MHESGEREKREEWRAWYEKGGVEGACGDLSGGRDKAG